MRLPRRRRHAPRRSGKTEWSTILRCLSPQADGYRITHGPTAMPPPRAGVHLFPTGISTANRARLCVRPVR